jgi:hypothetical protein
MRPALFALTAALMAAPAAAEADVLLSNLAEERRDASLLSEDLWAAQSFTNDANTWTLTSIRAVVGDQTESPDVFAELRDGSVTGTLLTSFSLPGFGGPESVRTFTPLSSVTLNPGGTYYFILGSTGEGAFDWAYAEGNNQVGTASFANFWYSEQQGADWTDFGGDNPFFLEVNGVAPGGAVPEPAAWALMITGFGLAGALVRRRRAAIAA